MELAGTWQAAVLKKCYTLRHRSFDDCTNKFVSRSYKFGAVLVHKCITTSPVPLCQDDLTQTYVHLYFFQMVSINPTNFDQRNSLPIISPTRNYLSKI